MRSEREEFPKPVKEAAWRRCKGHCEHPACGMKIMSGAIYDHFPIAAALGGPGTLENCRVLCARCNRLETDTVDKPRIAKAKRIDETRGSLRPKHSWPRKRDIIARRVAEALRERVTDNDS